MGNEASFHDDLWGLLNLFIFYSTIIIPTTYDASVQKWVKGYIYTPYYGCGFRLRPAVSGWRFILLLFSTVIMPSILHSKPQGTSLKGGVNNCLAYIAFAVFLIYIYCAAPSPPLSTSPKVNSNPVFLSIS